MTTCPQHLLAVFSEDGSHPKAGVREEIRKKLAYLCPGIAACAKKAISHSW